MQSCSFKKIGKCLGALLLAFCLALPAAVPANAAGGINNDDALRTLISQAKDGDVLYVDDIAFSQDNPDPIVINKSITIASLKDQGSAVFTHGTFLLDGSASDISVKFENITFYAEADTSVIRDESWSDETGSFQSALSFKGGADVTLSDCVFRNYMSHEGAALYADYSETAAKLSLNAENCAFLGNAVDLRGGAVLLIGQEGADNIRFTAKDCSFAGNLSSNHKEALGGGAIYAENAVLDMTACSLTANEGSHQYLTDSTGEAAAEAADGDAEAQAEPVYVKYADVTKGGALFARNCHLTMTDCNVAFNSASLGGGLAADNTEFVFRDGIIAHNRAASALQRKGKDGLQAETGMGGGLYINADSDLNITILNASIYGNSAYNAYSALYLEGMGKADLPYTVDLICCTYADNTVDTVYDKPVVPREDYFPEEADDAEKDDAKEQDAADKEKEKASEEDAGKAEKDAKKDEEAYKKAEEAYAQAVQEAIDKAVWDTLPGDTWSLSSIRPQASLIIDDNFSSLKRKKVLVFPRHELPSDTNSYVYYAAPEAAISDGFMPDVPSAEYVHVRATEAFRTAYPLPESLTDEFFSPYYDEILGTLYPGDNSGEGILTYQLLFEGAVWKEIEVTDGKSPELSAFGTEKEGYHFIAWQNPDGTPYQAGVSYYLPFQHETRQVNAIMEPNTYTIRFRSDAGTTEIQQVYGTAVTLPEASPKKGYEFVNWYKDDGSVAKDGEAYLLTRDSSYTAEYTKQFPILPVVILSALIVVIALFLIISRIVDSSRRKGAPQDNAEEDGGAETDAQQEEAPGEEAAPIRLPDPDEEAVKPEKAPAAAAAPATLSSADEGLRVPLDGAEELYAEESAAQEAEAALETAAEAEKAAKAEANTEKTAKSRRRIR